jgi:uncharacterized protein (DUF488 family)
LSKEIESQLIVYTIGHSNLPFDKFIDLLNSYQIQTLVDVRSSPYSRFNPQFNREILEANLKLKDIQYKYAGDFLGGRPKDPSCYKDGKLPEGHANYLHLVEYPSVMTKDFFIKGIERLVDIAKNEIVSVMCSEEDPAQCHRHHLIGKYLARQDITVLHIRADGNHVKDQHLPNLSVDPPAEQLSLF